MATINNPPVTWDHVKKYSPVSAYVSQLCDSINTIAYKVYQASSTVFTALGEKFALLGVVFVPLRVYNIVQIIKSNDRLKSKVIDIIIEVGGVFSGFVVVLNFLKKNVKQIIPALPYLVGISALFQAVDVYKKTLLLKQTKNALEKLNSNEHFALFYERIKEKKLTEKDKRILQVAYRFETDAIDPFCNDVARLENQEKVRELLKGRVERTLVSHKVLLTASVVEFLASALTLATFFVAPPVGFALGITNACVLGMTAGAKIGVFVHDHYTKEMNLKVPKEVEMQIILRR